MWVFVLVLKGGIGGGDCGVGLGGGNVGYGVDDCVGGGVCYF